MSVSITLKEQISNIVNNSVWVNFYGSCSNLLQKKKKGLLGKMRFFWGYNKIMVNIRKISGLCCFIPTSFSGSSNTDDISTVYFSALQKREEISSKPHPCSISPTSYFYTWCLHFQQPGAGNRTQDQAPKILKWWTETIKIPTQLHHAFMQGKRVRLRVLAYNPMLLKSEVKLS